MMESHAHTEAPGNVDDQLLAILCCPETKQGLRLLDAQQVDRLNALIARGELKNQEGKVVQDKLDGGLLREDGKVVYPIREQIPIMLIEEGIAVEGILSCSE